MRNKISIALENAKPLSKEVISGSIKTYKEEIQKAIIELQEWEVESKSVPNKKLS